MSSIFIKIIRREIPSYILKEDENHIAFLDAFPIAVGHTLVVPKKGINKLFDLSKEEYLLLMSFAYDISKALEMAIPCLRVGMLVHGLEISHAHVHLIPLTSTTELNFANKVSLSSKEFIEISNRIISYL